jgi:hypothetical protein
MGLAAQGFVVSFVLDHEPPLVFDGIYTAQRSIVAPDLAPGTALHMKRMITIGLGSTPWLRVAFR